MTDKLYGVWYVQENKWAQLLIPPELQLKYGRTRTDCITSATYVMEWCWFLLEEAQQIIRYTAECCGEAWSKYLIVKECSAEEVKQAEIVRLKHEDQRKRKQHADKYL